jgi:branched-chain amino acid transport system permease protein
MTVVELAQVSVRFGGVRALDGVTTGADAGRLTALIGPNGAGKTTLMNAICGITPPDAGSIRFRGRDVTRWRPHRIARLGMARTFQTVQLFDDMTVLENVLIGRHVRMRAGMLAAAFRLPRHFADERAARRFGERLLARLELSELAGEPATTLPYGLQRRIELARALAAEPALLVLDEPMAGLSGEETAELGRTIRQLVEDGLGVLLVEHAMEAVMSLSDHVVVLDRGSVLAEGPPARIQSDERVIAAYLGQA